MRAGERGIGPAVIVSAALLLVLIVLAVWLLTREPAAPPTAARPTPTAAVTPSAQPSAPASHEAGSVCGLGPAESSGTLTRAPAGTDWTLVGSVAAPSVPGAGPGDVGDDGLRTCYAPTPTGAVVAAANVVAMGSVPGLLRPLTEKMTAAGEGRQAALERLDAEPSGPGVPARYQIRGFRLLDYTGGRAAVDVAVAVDDGVLGSVPLRLAWQDGDWKVVLTDDGRLGTAPAPVPDLTGYTLWSGV